MEMDAEENLGSNDLDRLRRFATTLLLSGREIDKFWKNFEHLHLDIVKFAVDILKLIDLENLQVNFVSEEKTRPRENLLVCVLGIDGAAIDRP